MTVRAMLTTPHVTLRRLVCRILLVASDRRPNEEPGLTWPSFIELKVSDKRPMENDEFQTMMTVTKRRSEVMTDAINRPMVDKNGEPRVMWTSWDAEVLEPMAYYGSFVRMMADRCGLKAKSLSKWTEQEVKRISAEVAKLLTKKVGPVETARAAEFVGYPYGWQQALAAALEYGEEQGFWRESK